MWTSFAQTMPTGSCYMPSDYSLYIQYFTVLYNNKDELLNEVKAILQNRDQVCNSTKVAFTKLNTNLKNYLNYWKFDTDFYR